MALPKISRQIFKLISKLPAIAHKGIVNNKKNIILFILILI